MDKSAGQPGADSTSERSGSQACDDYLRLQRDKIHNLLASEKEKKKLCGDQLVGPSDTPMPDHYYVAMLKGRINDLTRRLEAATSRLEDVAQSTQKQGPSGAASTHTSTSNGAAISAPSLALESAKAVQEPLPPSIEAFDALMHNEVATYEKLSAQIGDLVEQQAAHVKKAFVAQRQVLLISTKAKKPKLEEPIYPRILKELQHEMGAVNDIREANRPSKEWNHLSAVAEGINCLAWLTIEAKPADYMMELFSGSKYYGDRVMMEFKEKDKKQAEWVKSWYKIFPSLAEYIRKYHKDGVTWNAKGVDAEAALKEVQNGPKAAPATPSAPGSNGPSPPPPPPPPLPTFDLNTGPPGKSTAKGGDASMGDVFSQLNQGASVTSGLRKVEKSEMTHKNPSLRAGGTVPTRSDSGSSRGKSPAPPGKKPKPESMRTRKPPRCELDGNKWIVENYDGEAQPVTIKASLSHHIMISRCSKTVVIVEGKANAISIENSPGLKLLIGSLVSSVDVIKSPEFALQVDGVLPTVLLDQVDSGTIYLSKASLGTEIFSSKCSSLNVVLPPESDEDDSVEHPLPEQLRIYIKDGKVLSEIVEHAG
ncbi:MAG: hypothetical protein M1814_004817 [Vezdaea aestivalis]|nr:MAG: hypothetical protein M1814_004817 [Vezdaea aestivalis]